MEATEKDFNNYEGDPIKTHTERIKSNMSMVSHFNNQKTETGHIKFFHQDRNEESKQQHLDDIEDANETRR
jgi:hypothetical protein